ncbi:MAG: L,D-transpeptidase family protein [Gammaproteobacteria bacterium]|jgi:D-alanyl-D-alanine dipeptidase
MLKEKIKFVVCAFFVLVPLCAKATNIPMPIILKQSKQLVLVTTNNWRAKHGTLQYFNRAKINKKWQAVSKPFTILVGQTGLAWNAAYRKFHLTGPYKTEGDFKSPAGAFSLKYAFGFAQTKDPQIKLAYIPLKNSTVCVADPNSKYYNQIIDRKKITNPDWRYQEIMRSTNQYQYGIIADYNRPNAKPYDGSCIFVHIWDQPYSAGTAGCTAMSEENLKKLLYWLDPAAKPVIVQLPQKQYQLLKSSWQLP